MAPHTSETPDLFDAAAYEATAEFLRARLPEALRSVAVGIVCGSGLGALADALDGPTAEFAYKDIPNFALSTVPGHAGKLVFGFIANKPIVCMVGRMHRYEGHPLTSTVFPIRIMRLLGASTLIVTNAAGGLNPSFRIGDIMLIADHVSFAGMGGQNALIGPNIPSFGPRFPPVSDAYDFDLRVLAVKAAHAAKVDMSLLREGTYSFVTGPSFETRAEARFLRDAVKADCVGMSTVPEVVVAKHAGMRVFGLSLITNMVAVGHGRSALAAGMTELGLTTDAVHQSTTKVQDDELQLASHDEVLATSAQRSLDIQRLVRTLVGMMPSPSA